MGWILGVVGAEGGSELRAGAPAFHPPARFTVRTPDLYLAAGGPAETTHHRALSAADGWFALGLGLRIEGGRTRILGGADWSRLMEGNDAGVRGLDGHYLLVRYSDGVVEVNTDPLGMRTLYMSRAGAATVFSNRLDWVARLTGNTEPDFGVLGSRLLLFNQLSTASLVRGIRRLGQGGTARIDKAGFQAAEVPWMPTPSGSPDGSMETILGMLACPVVPEGSTLLLGLSGGMDSRLLLSTLLTRRQDFRILTYGVKDEPDVCIASMIARRLGLPFELLEPEIPPADAVLEGMKEHQRHICLCDPATSFLKATYAHQLAGRSIVLIDGGFGEISRRQYLKRFVMTGRSALRSGEPERILPFLSVRRGEFFSADVRREMHRGALVEIDAAWRAMPPVDGLGLGEFADLLVVRTRFPNLGTMEQSRLDTLLPSYTPFAQPSMLNSVFTTDASLRRNGRYWRAFVLRNAPMLATIPLAKGDVTHPFRLGPISAKIWTAMAAGVGSAARSAVRDRVLGALRQPVMDLLLSRSVREAGIYDLTALTTAAEQYYAGRVEKGNDIDWWLAVEMWRAGLAGDAGKQG